MTAHLNESVLPVVETPEVAIGEFLADRTTV
ncbi:MAG: hypothetical protein ACJAYU_002683 [Bradymonadia bacterium]|jgi:hypothetical protein